MVYTADSKSAAFGRRGSSPLSGTTSHQSPINRGFQREKSSTISDIYSFLLILLLILSVVKYTILYRQSTLLKKLKSSLNKDINLT